MELTVGKLKKILENVNDDYLVQIHEGDGGDVTIHDIRLVKSLVDDEEERESMIIFQLEY